MGKAFFMQTNILPYGAHVEKVGASLNLKCVRTDSRETLQGEGDLSNSLYSA